MPRYRFVILAVVWLSYVMVFLARLSVGPLSPYLKASFDLSLTQVGGLMAATAVAYAPTLIVAGWLVDRVGVRRMLVLGTLVAGLCVGLLSLAPSYPWLLVLLALSGLGAGCIYPCAVKAVMTWFPLRERATAIGFNQTGVNLSGIIGAATLPALAERSGWQYGFLAVGLVGLAICVVAALFYRDPVDAAGGHKATSIGAPMDDGLPLTLTGSARARAAGNAVAFDCPRPDAAPPDSGSSSAQTAPRSPRADGPGAPSAAPAAAPPEASFLRTSRSSGATARTLTRRLLASRDIWILGAAGLFLGVVEFSSLAHLVVYLQEEWLYTPVAAGAMLALCEAAGGVAKPVSGFVSDRFLSGRRRPVLLGLCAVAGCCCLVLALAGPGLGWLVYAVLVLLGAAAVGWGGLFGTTAGELGGREAAGVAAGLTAASVNVGILIGPPLYGAIVDLRGDYGPAWFALAGASLAALVCVAAVREPSCHASSLSPESLSET